MQMSFFKKSISQVLFFWLASILFLMAAAPKTALFSATLSSILLMGAAVVIRKEFSILKLLLSQISRIRAFLFFLLGFFIIGWDHLLQDSGFIVLMIGLYILFEAIVFRIQKLYKN